MCLDDGDWDVVAVEAATEVETEAKPEFGLSLFECVGGDEEFVGFWTESLRVLLVDDEERIFETVCNVGDGVFVELFFDDGEVGAYFD